MLGVEKKPFLQSTQWYHFVRSNYITWFTDWLMTLASKCTEVVLYVTVLYSCAELYPGVTLPSGLTLAMFIIQMGALDIGGIGLSKMARQARKDGNVDGAHKAEILSRWLIGIMIASLVTASLTLAISQIPGFKKDQDAQTLTQVAQTVISLILVVARAVCAVLYGKIIHSLKTEAPDTILMPTKQADLETVIAASVAPLFQQVADLAHTVQLIRTSTESQILSAEREMVTTLKAFRDELKVAQSEENFRIAESLQRVEIRMIESLSPVNETLATLPAFTEQIEQIETTVTEQFAQVHSALEAHSRLIPSRVAPVMATKTVETKHTRVTQQAVNNDFDREAFVEACLRDDPDQSISTIQTKALAIGQSISTGWISSYRKAFFEKQGLSRDTGPMAIVESVKIS